MKCKLVEVEWRDAADHGGGWQTPDEIATFASKDAVITSVGWLYEGKGKYLALFADISDDDTVSRAIKIPKACVITMRVLRK